MSEKLWEKRWTKLRDSGVTFQQAQVVWEIVEEARGFHFQWLATYAWCSLHTVYGEPLDTESSASRQHYIDTGRYLRPEEVLG